MGRIDRVLGRLLLRTWAVLAFVAALASTAFGVVVLRAGHVHGSVLLLLGGLFVWLGLRACRDRATLGEALSRDFAPSRPARGQGPGRGTDA